MSLPHCPKYAAGALCHCRYCASKAWLDVCEKEIREQMRKTDNPMAEVPWHLSLQEDGELIILVPKVFA